MKHSVSKIFTTSSPKEGLPLRVTLVTLRIQAIHQNGS